MASTSTKALGEALGEIHDAESYPLPIFQQRTGQGRKGIAQARRQGLRVRKVGRRAYVLGRDWHQYLANQAGPPK